MSLSKRNITNEIDDNIGSPQKLSYEGSPSPDFSFVSSSSAIPLQETLPNANDSADPSISLSQSVTENYNSPSPAHSLLSSAPSSPMQSPVSSVVPFMRSRSPSPNFQPSSPFSLSSSHRDDPGELSDSLSFSSSSSSSSLSSSSSSSSTSSADNSLSLGNEAPFLERCEARIKARTQRRSNDKAKSRSPSNRKIHQSTFNNNINDAALEASVTSSNTGQGKVKPSFIFTFNQTQPSSSTGKQASTSLNSSHDKSLSMSSACHSPVSPDRPLSTHSVSSSNFLPNFGLSPDTRDTSTALYSPPLYEFSQSHALINKISSVESYQTDYPSVTINCAKSLLGNSHDNSIMSVTVTTCSSSGGNSAINTITSERPNPSSATRSISASQVTSLYNPPLNPQDYQTSPPIYKSSTSCSDSHSFDFRSIPSSSSIMYSYAPFSPRSPSALASANQSFFNLEGQPSHSNSYSIPGNFPLSKVLKSETNGEFSHKLSPKTFQFPYPESLPCSNVSTSTSQLKIISNSQANQMSHIESSPSSPLETKPCIQSESAGTSICDSVDNTTTIDLSNHPPTLNSKQVIKTDSAMAEIVDVEQQGPPSVVDLTVEDDDDVEIVSSDQPVVFLGSEPSKRRRLKRQRRDNSQASSSSSEPIVITDSPAGIGAGDSPTSAINVENIPDIPDTSISSSDIVQLPGDVGYQGQITPRLFGDLFNQSVIALDNDNELARNSIRNTSLATNYKAVHGGMANKRIRRERSDRSRSPLVNQTVDPNPGPSGSLLDAPIPPEVLDAIASIYAEQTEQQSPVTSHLKKNIFSTASDILHKAACGLSNMCMLSSHSRPISSQAPQPSTSASSSPEDSVGLSCPICFETFQDIKKVGRSLSSTVCGHIFCTNCLEAALKQTKLCPTCRKRLNKKQYHPLYI